MTPADDTFAESTPAGLIEFKSAVADLGRKLAVARADYGPDELGPIYQRTAKRLGEIGSNQHKCLVPPEIIIEYLVGHGVPAGPARVGVREAFARLNAPATLAHFGRQSPRFAAALRQFFGE